MESRFQCTLAGECIGTPPLSGCDRRRCSVRSQRFWRGEKKVPYTRLCAPVPPAVHVVAVVLGLCGQGRSCCLTKLLTLLLCAIKKKKCQNCTGAKGHCRKGANQLGFARRGAGLCGSFLLAGQAFWGPVVLVGEPWWRWLPSDSLPPEELKFYR